MKNIMK
ncbi:hypothetical protein RB653_006182 [Dictyostelium firmibasis]